MQDTIQTLALFAFAAALAFAVRDIQQRVKIIQIKQARLSLTYMRILTELDTLLGALILSRRGDLESGDVLEKVTARRKAVLRNWIETGPSAADLISGLEFPDLDDDPAFWSDNLLKELGLDESYENKTE